MSRTQNSRRVLKIQTRLMNHSTLSHLLPETLKGLGRKMTRMEILKDPAAGVNVLNALPKVQVKYLATQQKPLDAHPTMPGVVKWFLRRVYDYYGFAATDHNGRAYCSVEHRGVFDHEGDARWAAN